MANRTRKKSTNLTLSEDAIQKAKELKQPMHRPSVTNLVEVLIIEAHERHFKKEAVAA